jgi:F-type H+-transporting ATPase subunit delta
MKEGTRELPAAYARAVYDAALASWVRDLMALRNNLRRESADKAALDDMGIPFEMRRALIEKLLPPDSSGDLRNFAYTLVSDGRVALLDDIIVELRRLAEHGLNVLVAEVTTAVAPSDAERSSIEQRLVGRYGDGIDIAWHTDAAIIGGVIIRVGDEVTDDSVATRLESMRMALKGHA